MPDIDIDLLDRDVALAKIKHVPASMYKDKKLTKHNTGIYAQDIPMDPVTGLATLDYEVANKLGYFKIDFLNVSAYKGVRDEAHLVELMYKEPDWTILQDEDKIKTLFHISDHITLLKKLQPQSIDQLAAVLAIIRPGKRHLADSDWATIMQDVWVKPKEGYFFKKAHAIGYAYVIVVQMNLLDFADQS